MTRGPLMSRLISLPGLVGGAVALVAVLFAAGWATREAPADKPYLKVLGGGFMFNYRVADVYYGFTAAALRPLPTGSILVAEFEDPAGGAAHVVSTRLGAGRNRYSLRSPPVRGVQAGKPYHVAVKVTDREGKRVLWQDRLAFTSKISDAVVPKRPLTVGPGYARNPGG